MRASKKTGALLRPRSEPKQPISPKASTATWIKSRLSTTTSRRISATSVCRWVWAATSPTLQRMFFTTSTATAKIRKLFSPLGGAVGLHAPSVLINSSRKLDPDVPSPSQFDHVITMLPMTTPNEEVWMDTTSEVAPFRLLAFSLRNKLALVIPASGKPHLEETPADTPMPDTEISEVDGRINEIGKLEAHVHYTFRGDEELMLRSIFRRVPEAQWQRVVENVNAGMGGDITNLM